MPAEGRAGGMLPWADTPSCTTTAGPLIEMLQGGLPFIAALQDKRSQLREGLEPAALCRSSLLCHGLRPSVEMLRK